MNEYTGNKNTLIQSVVNSLMSSGQIQRERNKELRNIINELAAEMKEQAAFTHKTVEKYKSRNEELEEELTYAIEIIEDSGVDYEEIRTAYLLDEVIE